MSPATKMNITALSKMIGFAIAMITLLGFSYSAGLKNSAASTAITAVETDVNTKIDAVDVCAKNEINRVDREISLNHESLNALRSDYKLHCEKQADTINEFNKKQAVQTEILKRIEKKLENM